MRGRDERGSVLPVTALLAVVLLLIAATTVDLGMQRSARRDMQALADIVALDLARLVDGRTGAQIRAGTGDKTPLETAKTASVDRNKTTVLGDDPGVCTDGTCVRAYLVEVDEAGNYPMSNGVPQEVLDSEEPGGVVVVASTEVGFAFGGLVGFNEGGVSRRALGIAESSACYQLGSYAASIDPSSSDVFEGLLKPILGASTLNLAGYQGLASADVTIFELISAPSIAVGSVDELLALPDLTVGDLFLASAHALTGQGKIAEAAVLNAAAASIVAPFVLDFNDVLSIDGSSEAVLGTHLNVLDLLVGTVFLANGDNFLDVANLQAGLASVGVTTNTALKIIERARRWCTGYETAGPDTSQITFSSNIKVEPNNSPLVNTARSFLRLVNPISGSPDATLNLDLDIDLAGARAELTDSSCDPDVFDVDVWTNLLTGSLTASAHVRGNIAGNVTLLGIGVFSVVVPVDFDVTVGASFFKPAATVPEHVTLSYPPLDWGDYVSVGSGDVVLPDVNVTQTAGTLQVGNVTVSVLGLPVTVPTATLLGMVTPVIENLMAPTGALYDRVVPLVQPVADVVNDILVQLNHALGLNLGGADVYGLEESICGAPKLAG